MYGKVFLPGVSSVQYPPQMLANLLGLLYTLFFWSRFKHLCHLVSLSGSKFACICKRCNTCPFTMQGYRCRNNLLILLPIVYTLFYVTVWSALYRKNRCRFDDPFAESLYSICRIYPELAILCTLILHLILTSS